MEVLHWKAIEASGLSIAYTFTTYQGILFLRELTRPCCRVKEIYSPAHVLDQLDQANKAGKSIDTAIFQLPLYRMPGLHTLKAHVLLFECSAQ